MREGLEQAEALGVGHGCAELLFGAQSNYLWARGELVYKPLQWLSLYGYGEGTSQKNWEAGIGARARW